MKITKKYLEDNIDKFRKSDMPIEGVKTIGIQIVHKDKINNKTATEQFRQFSDDKNRVIRYQTSFKNGIDFDKPIPVLEIRPDGKYNRFDGFGRSGYLDTISPYYVYQIIECVDDKARILLRGRLNCKSHQEFNTELDLVQALTNLVNEKHIDNTQTELEKAMVQMEPHLTTSVIGKYVQAAMERLNTKPVKEKIWTYNASTLNNWIKHTWDSTPKYGFKIGGNKPYFNKKSNTYQISLANSYVDRKMYQVLKNYEDGKKTEILLTACKFNSKSSLHAKRQECLNDLMDWMRVIDNIAKTKINWKEIFSGLLGFVPQEEDEVQKTLIPLDNYKFNF